MALTEHEKPLTPDWFLLKLGRELRDRNENRLKIWRDYYRGDHPLPPAPPKATEIYRAWQKQSRTNICALPVEAATHRMNAIGVTDADGNEMPELWSWWKLNKMNARQKQLYRGTFSSSVGYIMVTEHYDSDLKNKGVPLFSLEHPREVILYKSPLGETLASLKAWYDETEKVGKAEITTPDKVVEYRTNTRGPGRLPWGHGNWDRKSERDNKYGFVNIVEFTCRDDLGELPEPLFHPIIDIQDRINFGVFNRMTAERFAAFPQKAVANHKVQTVKDPATGRDIPVNPFIPGPDNVWVSEEDAKFTQLPAAALDGFLKVYASDVRTAFVLTSTPAYYMPGQDLVNIATDTITALDTNHVAQVREHQAHFGEGFEDVYIMGAKIVGADVDLSEIEFRWEDPRNLNPASIGEYGKKLREIGYEPDLIAEKMGEPPEVIAKVRTSAARAALLNRTAPGRPTNDPRTRGTNPGVPGPTGPANQ